jgi:hypothetical protein
VLTDAKVKSWVSSRKLRDGESRSLTEEAVRLRRLLRVQRGLPSMLGLRQNRRIAPPPLREAELAELHRRCHDAGVPALRGFTAAFGAGVTGAAMVGAQFIATGGGVSLRLVDGTVKVIVGRFDNADLADAAVHEGDWTEVVYVASKMRLYLQPANALQTFREQALSEPQSLAVLCRRYRLSEEAVNSTVDYVDQVDLCSDRSRPWRPDHRVARNHLNHRRGRDRRGLPAGAVPSVASRAGMRHAGVVTRAKDAEQLALDFDCESYTTHIQGAAPLKPGRPNRCGRATPAS